MKKPLDKSQRMWYNIITKGKGKFLKTRKVKIMMNTVYKVTAYGGMDGRRSIEDYYATKEAAYEAIRKETWNSICGVYEVEVTINDNGKIITKDTAIARPHTAREREFNQTDEYTEYID